MKLFILRHGEAESMAASDDQRRLTERGRAQTTEILQQSAADLQSVTRIVASPYVRAQQTASLAAQQLQLPIATEALITPDSSPQGVIKWLQQWGDDEVLLLVSHQPLVGSLVDSLCGLPRGQQIMGTSALAALRMTVAAPACADLLWLRQP